MQLTGQPGDTTGVPVADVSADTVCEDLWRLLKEYKRHGARIADEYGLTMIQFGAMQAIYSGQTTMGKVAQAMHCDASNATGLIDRLTALKFVTRQEDARDRRVKSLRLTPLGEATMQGILRQMPVALGCDRLTTAERAQVHGAVCKLLPDDESAATSPPVSR